MSFLNGEKFIRAVNSDPEFMIAARYWNVTLKVVVGDEVVIIKVKDGVVTDVFEPSGRNFLIEMHEYDIVVSAPAHEWARFFEQEPKPFYHDLFAAVIRHDFEWGGDVRLWFAYYGALRQLFSIMRGFVSLPQEV